MLQFRQHVCWMKIILYCLWKYKLFCCVCFNNIKKKTLHNFSRLSTVQNMYDQNFPLQYTVKPQNYEQLLLVIRSNIYFVSTYKHNFIWTMELYIFFLKHNYRYSKRFRVKFCLKEFFKNLYCGVYRTKSLKKN